ncbi:MAG: hypothetical protein Q7J47_06045 [Azoarcus sp.]|nr:hypothetical protein [Azoarcus sp.]
MASSSELSQKERDALEAYVEAAAGQGVDPVEARAEFHQMIGAIHQMQRPAQPSSRSPESLRALNIEPPEPTK